MDNGGFICLMFFSFLLILAFAFCKSRKYLYRLRYLFLLLGMALLLMTTIVAAVVHFRVIPKKSLGFCTRVVDGIELSWSSQGYSVENPTARPRDVVVQVAGARFSIQQMPAHSDFLISRNNPSPAEVIEITVDSAPLEISLNECLEKPLALSQR